jgi:hypothetical protein
MNARAFSKKQGFSLIEVLIAGAMMTVVGLGVATMINGQNRQVSNIRAYSSRDQVRAQLDQAINSYAALVASTGGPGSTTAIATAISANNNALFNCINGTGPCVQTAGGASLSFYLIPAGAQFLDQNEAIAGTTAQPVYYDKNGRRCTFAESGVNGTTTCFLRARAAFGTYCPGGVTPCTVAEKITVSYTLDQAPGVALTDTNVATRTITSQVSTIEVPLNGNCSQNDQVVIGQNGSSLTCNLPLRQNRSIAVAGSTTNQSGTRGVCAAGMLVNGVNQDGSVSCSQVPVTPVGGCTAPDVLVADAAGNLSCQKPLRSNVNGPNAVNANGQAGIGQCQAGQIVTSINTDGSVACTSAPQMNCGPGLSNERVVENCGGCNAAFASGTIDVQCGGNNPLLVDVSVEVRDVGANTTQVPNNVSTMVQRIPDGLGNSMNAARVYYTSVFGIPANTRKVYVVPFCCVRNGFSSPYY